MSHREEESPYEDDEFLQRRLTKLLLLDGNRGAIAGAGALAIYVRISLATTSGFVAFGLMLLTAPDGASLPRTASAIILPAIVAIGLLPLLVLFSYMLRVGTVADRTAATAPFTTPAVMTRRRTPAVVKLRHSEREARRNAPARRQSTPTSAPRQADGSEICTTCFPTLSPEKSPRNASGACSSPSTTVSR